ncbi:MAG: hypothetical protein Q9162_005265 [Coniocarpon cinnabarinum]
MALTGRRRTWTPNLPILLTLIFCICIQTASAASAVIGLDVGTEYIKAALVKPGVPLDIVLTKDSKRKEAAAIGFKPSANSEQLPERLYGSDALAVAPRFSNDVYPNLKPLLGSLADTETAVQAYGNRFPGLKLEKPKDGTHVSFATPGKAQESFTVEELLAMEMANIKQNAEVMAGKGYSVQNAVITVPAFYTVDERRAVELAAQLAGLEVMSLVSDGLAVGLNYATPRKFPNVDQGEKAEYHLVYDMGAGSTTASVLRFQARSVKDVGRFNKTVQEVNVIGTAWDRTLGGDVLNELIVDDMVEKFIGSSAAKTQGIEATSVKSHGRAMAKLWREAERLRQVLSANTATTANMESLYEDIDFKYKLSRTDFETLAASYSDRIAVPIQDALAGAKLQLAELDSIVLHGGMVRTPFVQKSLESLVGDPAKLKSNVNADEAAVFGAAFKAAGLSPSFKVKDIKSNDAANYAATLRWTANGKERSQKVFVPASQAGTVKQLPFNISEDAFVAFSQQVAAISGGATVERTINEFKIGNLTASQAELVSKHGCSKDNIKTTLAARLDPVTGLPDIYSGSVSCEVDESEKKGSMYDGVKGLFGLGGKKDQEPFVNEDEEVSSTETIPPSEAASETASELNSSATASSASPSATPKVAPEKKTISINLAIQQSRTDLRQPTTEQFKAMQARIAAFDASDKARRLREETYNTLESYTYRARDFLEDQGFIGVSTSEQRKAIEDMISSTSDWLHGEGASALTDTVKERYDQLKAIINPVQKRKEEQQKRPAAVESLRKTLNQTESVARMMRELIDKAADAALSASSSTSSATSVSSIEDADYDDGYGLDDLEQEPSSSTVTAAPTPSVYTSPYTESDYETLSGQYEKVKEWLEEQTGAQEALSVSDDPAFFSSDVNSRTKQLNELMSRMLSKQVKPSKSSKSKSDKSSKTSKAKSSKKSGSLSSPSSSSGAGSTASEAEASSSHSEL